MRILYSREDGSEYLFLRPGAPLCRNNVHQEDEQVQFADSGEAAILLRRLARNPATLAALRALLPPGAGSTRLTSAAVLRRLAHHLWRGAIIVQCRRYARDAYFLENVKGSSAPAVPPPTPRPAPIEELDTFPLMHDALAQAKALKEAAQGGVPFCEECARR